MPTHRHPALLCRDAAGLWTAVVAGADEPHAAFAATRAEAVSQLREYLQWLAKEGFLPDPDFDEPQLMTVRVEVRPEYRDEKKVFPCDQELTLRVPCIHGRQDGGMFVATMPLLGVRFYFHEAATLRDLARRYATQKLEGLTPADLARLLPPARTELAEIVVRVKVKERKAVSEALPATLQKVAEPLGDRAVRKQFSRAWERDALVAEVVHKLKREQANVLLVGEGGVGKTTVLADAVRAIESIPDPERPPSATPRLFWQTSAGRLIAGMRYLGQWEERVEEVIGELQTIGGVLCVERLLGLVRLGGFDASDSIAAFLIPFLQRRELRMAAEATPAELEACRRLLPGLAELFQIVHVPPLGRPEALGVLQRLATGLAQNTRTTATPAAADRVYRLFRRFLPYQGFPGRAVSFVRQLFEKAAPGSTVGPEEVLTQFVKQTGLPEPLLRDDLTLDRSDVMAELQREVIDQSAATEAAADLVMTFKAGLNDPLRPLGVMLFCGPTGVGKTALAKALSRYLFGHGGEENRLIRLDMSEYAGFDAAQRLLGPPHGEPSDFVRRVRQQPFCVVLLDEIEKAGPDVFDVLLGVLDEGRLTDRFGRVTTFRSAVIVMTSNLGAERQRSLGFGREHGPRYSDEARAFFRPEFFNRLDAVVTFDALAPSTVRDITRKELTELSRREGLARANLTLDPSPELVEYLAREGFDARYGARPLQRTIERLVIAPLARWLLERPELRAATVKAGLDVDGKVVMSA